MRWYKRLSLVAALAVAALGSAAVAAERASAREAATFGVLTPPSETAIKVQAATWLREAGKYETARQQFDAIWADKETPALDRLAATFALGHEDAATLLKEARNHDIPAPIHLPSVLKDGKQSLFFRANLALAYAKALSGRKVHEEALETFKQFKAEQVVDPASYLFHRAVAEHALMLKKEADDTISRLLDDVPTAPERYKMVAALMHFDMVSWQDKDLAAIGRKMDNIQRRLELTRGGKKTQKLQKEVVARLDEIIKELENQCQGGDCPNGGNCPSGGQAKGNGSKPGKNIRASSPQQDSIGGDGSGPGQIDAKKIKELAEVWGKLPARDREASMRELTQSMPARYREVIREYFRKLSEQTDAR
jgi:hypothetical protein